MPVITEIRQFKIPPCKIDKDLIGSLGKILESDEVCKQEEILYSLDSGSRKIESTRCNEFAAAEWPNEARSITITVGEHYPGLVLIDIDFKYMSQSKVKVSSSDATWANGLSKRLEEVFDQRKPGYSAIVEYVSAKLTVVLITWLSLSVALTYISVELYRHFGTNLKFISGFFAISTLGGMVGGFLLLYLFLDWLFPRFEFGETLQSRLRNWIWSLLISSGALAILLDKLLDL